MVPGRQEAPAEQCPRCGYCLIGLRDNVCPECGTCFTDSLLREYWVHRKQRARAIRLAILVSLLAGASAVALACLVRSLFMAMSLWPPGETAYWLTNGKSRLYNLLAGELPSWVFVLIVGIVFLRLAGLIRPIANARLYVHEVICATCLELPVFLFVRLLVGEVAFFD